AGDSSILNTTLLTGADATFTKALLAAGVAPPSAVVNAETSTVSALPLAVPADGTSMSTVTVTLKNADGIPIAGKLVSLSGNTGNATIAPSGAGSDMTNSSGQATFTVKSSIVETEVFSATGDSVPITATASVAFTLPITDAGNSTVTAAPAIVAADGTTQSIITITLKNSGGQPLPGKLVSLAKTAGPGAPSINPAATGTDTTDANGVATFTITSPTSGTVEFTATCDTDSVTLTSAAVSVDFVTPDASALLAYEGFDYPLGVLTGNNGGTGFSGGWLSPEASFVCQVYDENGGTLATWDNVVSGVTMSSPPRYIASVDTANPGSTAARILASDAGTLAGADNVLWMGVVFHYEDTNGSAGLNIGLSSLGGSVIDRGRRLNTSGMDFIGVTNWNQATATWNNRINATIVNDHVLGTGYTGAFAQTPGTQALSTTEDLLVVMKFTFGASDRVEAAFFKESDSLSEAAFYSSPSYVSATYLAGIDESALDTLSYTQQRGFNALDEIRIGSTFANTFAGGTTDPDYETWAGNYPGLGAMGDDDDGDSLTNDVERIFGLNPQNSASANPYVIPFDAATGGFSYTRRTQSLTGLSYKVWYSTDLQRWFEDTVGSASQAPGTPTNDVEVVGVTVDPSLLTEPKLFVQISAEDLGPPPPAPELSSLWGSGTTITLNFSEEMNETSATDTANYTVELDGGSSIAVSGASLSGGGKTVTLTLGSALGIDSAYNVVMSNLTGSSGQPMGGSGRGLFQTWDDDPTGIKVFILAGQSNMVGYGKTEDGGNPLWTEGGTEPKEIPGG
ncbi:MAG: hypothetical protein GW893_10345, partial [Armatimonadetes bacterium]|nr:hypothetical protein [Armatimonadota bacterium]